MRVLVTGGTGYVGPPVVARLQERGHEVRALVRSPGARLPAGVEAAAGDVTDRASLERAAQGVDAIVHLVAVLDASHDVMEAVNAGGPRNVVAAAQAAGVRRLVHMSALGVTAEHAPLTHYWETKWAGASAVMESGLEWTVMEPSFVFGGGGGAFAAFERLVRLPVTPVIGDGRYRHQPVWRGDVATAFANALERPDTMGKRYELGGPEALTFDDLLDEVARAIGRRPRRKLHAPAGFVRAQTPVLRRLPPPLKVTPEQITMLLDGTACDIGPMRCELGVEPASIAAAYSE
jgi:uncharacterized protein YbjT (DUF2867 family)